MSKNFIIVLLIIFSGQILIAQSFTFTPVGTGLSNSPRAMHVYKNELYVTGSLYAGGLNIKNIGRWNGSQWKKVGNGFYFGKGNCFTIHNGLLFLGGDFIAVLDSNEQQINNTGYLIAWDGTNWIPILTQPIINSTTSIDAIASYNGDLYIGGNFFTIENTPINRIARWDGQQWYDIGVSVISYFGSPSISSMAVYNNELYVGGRFSKINGVEAFNIARWNGNQWHSVGTGTNDRVHRLFTDSLTNRLIVGGQFTIAGNLTVPALAFWKDSIWIAPDTNLVCSAIAIERYNNLLFFGGSGGCTAPIRSFVFTNDPAWSVVNEFPDSYSISAMKVFNNELFIGGEFSTINNFTMNNITRLNINTVVPLNSEDKKKGIENNVPNPFSQTTTIPFHIPIGTKQGYLSINNIYGKHIETIQLDLQKTQVEINLQNLEDGVYTYSLIVDEKIFQTKKMIMIK